jgi:Zn-dependent peptidase ImmA (M78 family)/transcriptional regulator with XRE-family HTH domain
MESPLGARIRAARERTGMQSQELAARIGIDPSAMSNIESGKRAVKTRELVLIAEALSVSPLALLDEDSLPARMHVAARLDGKQSTIEGEAYSRLRALGEIHAVLADAGLPSANTLRDVPQFQHEWSWKAEAEQLADWATKHLGVEPTGVKRFNQFANAIEERLGVDVIVEKYPSDPLSGAAITARDFPLIFVNAQHPTPRALFTLAHECGHLLLSHDGSTAVDDTLAGSTQTERQANAFAAAFLMPADKVDHYIGEYGRGAESLARMLYDFQVSYESLIYRLHSLRRIDTDGKESLSAVGWQGLLRVIVGSELRERLEPEIFTQLISRLGKYPAERPPSLLAARCFTGYQRGVISVRPLAGLFKKDPDEFYDRMYDDDEKSAEVLERVEGTLPEEQVSDEELFAGIPVL